MKKMKMNILKHFGLAVLAVLGVNAQAALPTAVVSEVTDSTELATYASKINNFEKEIKLDSEGVFTLMPKRAYKFACDQYETEGNEYLSWWADFTVSFDKPIAKNSMGLFGYYGTWFGIGFFAPQKVPADYEVPLLNYMTKKSNWNYQQIRDDVKTFICGAFNLSVDNDDTLMTVRLRLFHPDMTPADIRDPSKWIEGVNTHVVKTIDYKLSDVMNVPAKADLWPELEYADIAYAEENKMIPAGYYALEGNEFVMLEEAKSVTEATAYFKPAVAKEEVKVEADETEVKNNTKVIDEHGEEHEVPAEQKAKVEEKVGQAVEEITENTATLEKTDTGVTAKEILTETYGETTVVKDTIKEGIRESAKGAEPDVQAAVDTALNSRDVSSKINIKLEATSVTIQQAEQVEVTVEKAVFDVKPMATVTIITGTEKEPIVNEFTTVIKNEDLAGKTLTVRLPLPKSFTHNVLVIHETTDPNYPAREEFIVASQKDETTGDRFCEVQVTHFSSITAITTTQPIPVKYESTDVLGIIRRNDSGSGKDNYENAISVPWMSRGADGALVQGMTVADLITANGLGEGDELHVWIPDNDTTHGGKIGEVEVTRKGTYAIFKWDATQQKWIGAKDMDSGDIAVGTDYVIPRGAAVWYKRASETTGDYTIVGLVSNACETEIKPGTLSEPVMTLLVNPFPENVDAVGIAGVEGDELVINRTSSDGTNVRYVRKSGNWGKMMSSTKTIGNKTIPIQTFLPVSSIPVANGQSFWYVSRGGSAITINWKAIKAVGNAN